MRFPIRAFTVMFVVCGLCTEGSVGSEDFLWSEMIRSVIPQCVDLIGTVDVCARVSDEIFDDIDAFRKVRSESQFPEGGSD